MTGLAFVSVDQVDGLLQRVHMNPSQNGSKDLDPTEMSAHPTSASLRGTHS